MPDRDLEGEIFALGERAKFGGERTWLRACRPRSALGMMLIGTMLHDPPIGLRWEINQTSRGGK